MKIRVLLSVLIVSCASFAVRAEEALKVDNYVGTDVMIPMRDGIKLHAQVWRPQGDTRKLPILFQRSPYGYGLDHVKMQFSGEFKELAADGFIIVLQDIRGRFSSEGNFVMLRPKATREVPIDESTDTYDSIDWLLKSVSNNNGNVGMLGISYMGWTTAMATINPHPALKAISVQASPEDMFLGDDFHHNGAFRFAYGWEYCAALETDGRTLTPFDFKKEDPYSWYLRQDNLASLDQKSVGHALPMWQNFVAHPNYDAYWQAQVTSPQMPAQPRIPNLIVAGWWDQEDFYGPLNIYERQEKGDRDGRNFIVIGPWNHGGWARSDGDEYGPFDLGSKTSPHFRGNVEVPWFRHFLKGEGELKQPEAYIFETGSNQWQSLDAWPPRKGVVKRKLFLHANRAASFDASADQRGGPGAGQSPSTDVAKGTSADKAMRESDADQFVSDPANPVPYRPRPIAELAAENTTWPQWLADDQKQFADRPDVLLWQTSVLDKDVTLRGDVTAQIYASTTGTDADWIVKVVDVYPNDEATPAELRGRHLMIANDVFRGRFRKSFEKPEAIPAGEVQLYTIDLHSASHVFKKGHRIAVHVQSTWFPLIDRNPQTFLPSIFKASGADYKAQTHKVFHSRQYPSAVVMDIAAAGR